MSSSSPKPFPVPNSTVSFWRNTPHELENHRSTEELPTECDIVVIGAGYAGASVVYHILDGNPSPPSIVILEARGACSGATGRNGGHLKPSPYQVVINQAAKHGLEAATELAQFEVAHVAALKQVIEKEKIDCDFHITRAVDAQLDEKTCRAVKDGYDGLLATSGVSTLLDVEFTQGATAERISGVKDTKGCLSFTAGYLWPYKLVMHLLRLAVDRGVHLQTNTPVSDVSSTPDPTTGRWTVTTQSRGSIRAKTVVFATNAYTAALVPQYQGKIVPVRGICSRIVTPANGAPAPHLPNTYSLRWSAALYDYLIPRPDDGSIIVGGARRDYLSDPKNWYNVVDDSRLIESAKHYFDGYMQRHFHGWEDTGAYTDRVWTGIMGYSSDYLPHVGHVPGKPGQLIIAGFSGHGMPQIFLAAKGIAKIIRKGVPFEETGVPRLYRTSQERLDSKEEKILSTAGIDSEKARL